MSQFTLDEALRYCKRATDTFLKNCSNPLWSTLLSNLKYQVKINNRIRVTAGRARKQVRDGKVYLSMELNGRLLSRVAAEEDRYQDVSHELAHLLDFAIRGVSNHDGHWKNLHQLMGGKAERCHAYDVSELRNRVKRVLLTDLKTGQEYLLSKRRYQKMYHFLVMANLSEPGKYKTKWLNPEEVLAYIITKKKP